MVARVKTVAFLGIEARPVDVEVMIAGGVPTFAVVGLPDKAVSEARERVRAALGAVGMALPPKRITVNLAPADLPKEGSHFDLPIALAILAAMNVIPAGELAHYLVLGELGLDGGIAPVNGVLPAAMTAAALDCALICPQATGPEAAWAGEVEVVAAPSLLALVNHLRGRQVLSPPAPAGEAPGMRGGDLRDIKGQETAKRALEVAAAGGHHMLMIGPPGAGKSLMAACLPGILPPLSPREALEVSMIQSVAGALTEGRISRQRPYRAPHHSASMAALTGGGMKARPGEISLAHKGILFLDELAEFSRAVLDSLRQPLETGMVTVARANAHLDYPADVQLIAAMNPCRCGHLGDAALACHKAPRCAQDYQSRISGPLMDRMDIHIDVAAVSARDLTLPPPAEDSATVAARVAEARDRQQRRFEALGEERITTNARADGRLLETVATPDDAGARLLEDAADRFHLTARGYHRVLRVARTLADLEGVERVMRSHIAEALGYRRVSVGG